MEKIYRRHKIIWKILQFLIRGWVIRKFNMSHEDIEAEGPVLLVPNHVNSWDPLLVSMSLKDKQTYFVASEHIFRKGFLSKLLIWLVGPIPMRKGSPGTDTVRTCLRHLKAGRSVCIFAEGEQSWDGRNNPLSPAIGKLAKISGASLVTYRLEGSYLSKPRWADTVRRGRVYGHPVKVYSPEVLRTMSPEEIAEAIGNDIHEDAWERQKTDRTEYKGKDLAFGLERALYLCPSCKKTGTLKTQGSILSCSCGLEITYRPDGFFEPATPFSNISEWEDWQKRTLKERDFPHGEYLFRDSNVKLTAIGDGHSETPITEGDLIQTETDLVVGSSGFSLQDIDNMAMTRTHILLFTSGDIYYQISSDKGINLRKYFEIWKSKKEN